ncbi:MAG: aspartyl/asparaginyl beta-hydroxylase domain-containing protein [Pseudomonadota bacterium]
MIPVQQRTRYLKLSLNFDIDRLKLELDNVFSSEWINHFNTRDYENGWSCVPLRSVDGRLDHIMSVPDQNFLDTDILKRCAYFQEVLNTFECEKTSVRLMSLEPGGIIKPHTDLGTSFEDGLARLHIPIVTDPMIMFVIDGELIHFSRGATWYLNASCVHSVTNVSSFPRIHLMLDCIPNPWLQQLFDKADFIPNAKPKYHDASINDDNVVDVIKHLRAMGNPTSLHLADELSKIHSQQKIVKNINH